VLLLQLLKKSVTAKGKSSAVDRAFERIRGHRDEVAALLRARQGEPEEAEVTREIPCDVPGLATQKENYRRWFMQRSNYYHPSEEQLNTMWDALEPDDLVHFDFAHSITVQKPNGLFIAIDRKGRIIEPSPYSPALKRAREPERGE